MRYHQLHQWLAERLPFEIFLPFFRNKKVPIHRYSLWYYLGNVILTCLLIQIVTGVILLFHYQPTPATAYESIRLLILKVRYGWLIRSLHLWGANVMIAALWVHLFSTFFSKAYRRPREFIWLTGCILFIIVMGLGFSGYLLPWSEHSFLATRVGTGIAGQTPLIGHGLKIFLRGGEEIGDATLTRFFALHVAFLPLALIAVAGLHLLLIQLHGLSVPLSFEEKKFSLEKISFFPEFVLRDLAISCWIIGIVVIFAVLFPCEAGKKLDPQLIAPDAAIPAWYFIFMFNILRFMPAKIGSMDGSQLGILFLGAGFLFIFLTPFIERNSKKGKSSPFFTITGIVMVIFILLMTLFSLESDHLIQKIATETIIPVQSEINQAQYILARKQIPGMIVFVASIISLGILLWRKARDLEILRKQGFFLEFRRD
ncbi:Cytochrome bc complex cytochrome b subunit [Gammaproteobacteria bacterium]